MRKTNSIIILVLVFYIPCTHGSSRCYEITKGLGLAIPASSKIHFSISRRQLQKVMGAINKENLENSLFIIPNNDGEASRI